MPHGTPDWGLVGPKSTIYGLDDLGEHAVRLGSPHLFDRRGDVIWMTDFRNGMGSVQSIGPPGFGAVSLWAGYTRQGAFCVRLMPLIAAVVGLQKVLPYPVYSRMGLEFSFSVDVRSDYIVGQLYADDTVNEMQAQVRYNEGNDRLEYADAATPTVWQPIADNLDVTYGEYCPHTLKMVVDLAATPPEYVRVIFNDVTYSLSGIPLRLGATTGVVYARARVTHWADGMGDADISVDNVIVTQNEP